MCGIVQFQDCRPSEEAREVPDELLRVKLTLHLGIFHHQQESVAQGGAHSLRASKEEIEGGEDQVLEVEFCVRVAFILKAKESIKRMTPSSLHLPLSFV